MDVTPPPKMYDAMWKLTDAVCGEAPGVFENGPGANKVRENRALLLGTLHRLVAMAMREGAARAFDPCRTELGAAQVQLDVARNG